MSVFTRQLQGGKYQGNLETPDEINTVYSLTKELGKGAYGTVYLAENRETKFKWKHVLHNTLVYN